MTLQLTVSPDFSPDHIAGWYVFNTWLQRKLGVRCHLELYDDFDSQHRAIAADGVDLIFANPYDAAMLVRDKGFAPLAAPVGAADEALIAVAAGSTIVRVEDLKPGSRIAQTHDPDVNLIGMIMLEPADLKAADVTVVKAGTYVLVAKNILLGRADGGFFLQKAFDDLSATTRSQLRVLVRSQISVVRHVLLAGPRFAPHAAALTNELLAMSRPGSDGLRTLESLGMTGWEAVDAEDTEFMIDLMDALMR